MRIYSLENLFYSLIIPQFDAIKFSLKNRIIEVFRACRNRIRVISGCEFDSDLRNTQLTYLHKVTRSIKDELYTHFYNTHETNRAGVIRYQFRINNILETYI